MSDIWLLTKKFPIKSKSIFPMSYYYSLPILSPQPCYITFSAFHAKLILKVSKVPHTIFHFFPLIMKLSVAMGNQYCKLWNIDTTYMQHTTQYKHGLIAGRWAPTAMVRGGWDCGRGAFHVIACYPFYSSAPNYFQLCATTKGPYDGCI